MTAQARAREDGNSTLTVDIEDPENGNCPPQPAF